MPNKHESRMLKTPVQERRGVWTTFGADTWEAILVRSGFDVLFDRLGKGEGIGAIERDVTGQVLVGELPAPSGAWFLVVELLGTPWLHVAHGYRRFEYEERLIQLAGAPVLRTGYQDTAGATYARINEGASLTLDFESTGMGPIGDGFDGEGGDFDDPFDVPLRFETDLLPDGWADQFEREDELQQVLMQELDAYVPMLGAAVEGDKVGLWAGHEDVLDPEYIKRVGLVLVGQKRSPRGKKNPADQQLSDAISGLDPDGVRAAIAAGASLSVLPKSKRSPLGLAVNSRRTPGTALLEVVGILLEAGADPDDGGAGQNPPLVTVASKAARRPVLMSGLTERLVEAGASMSVHGGELMERGQTPLHVVAFQGNTPMAQMLLARGADIRVKDKQGRTPRQAVEDSIEQTVAYMGDDAEDHLAGQRGVVSYLASVEDGGPVGDGWEPQLREQQRKLTRAQREMKIKVATAGKLFKKAASMDEHTQAGPGPGQAGKENEAGPFAGMSEAKIKRRLAGGEDGIEIAPDNSQWEKTKRRDQYASRLNALGFETIGYFIAKAGQPVRMLAFVNPSEQLYATIYEPQGQAQFSDIVRLHADGSVLTVTSNDQDPPYELDRFSKIRMPRVGVARLVERMLAEPVPGCGIKSVSAASFSDDVRRVTREEKIEYLSSLLKKQRDQ